MVSLHPTKVALGPIIDSFEWDSANLALKVLFNNQASSGGFVLYSPMIRDLKTNDIITYSQKKLEGFRVLNQNPLCISYDIDPMVNPYKDPAKVLLGKQYVPLKNAEVYVKNLIHLLTDDLTSSILIKH